MNPEEGKLLCKMYLDTIQQEAETTKKVIRAIPDDQMSYKPDPKSKNAHELAWHIASSEVWFLDEITAAKRVVGLYRQLAARWTPEIDALAAWRPSLWPILVVWTPLALLLIWLGLILGGYLPAPAWLAAQLGF